jgi:hypothetical protein
VCVCVPEYSVCSHLECTTSLGRLGHQFYRVIKFKSLRNMRIVSHILRVASSSSYSLFSSFCRSQQTTSKSHWSKRHAPASGATSRHAACHDINPIGHDLTYLPVERHHGVQRVMTSTLLVTTSRTCQWSDIMASSHQPYCSGLNELASGAT